MKLPRIEIRKDDANPWGKVVLNGTDVPGVTEVSFTYRAGDIPAVTLELDAGELEIDAEVIANIVASVENLSRPQALKALEQLRAALTILSGEEPIP